MDGPTLYFGTWTLSCALALPQVVMFVTESCDLWQPSIIGSIPSPLTRFSSPCDSNFRSRQLKFQMALHGRQFGGDDPGNDGTAQTARVMGAVKANAVSYTSCISARFSYRRRRRRNWFIHAQVRSMTQRRRPRPLPFFVLRIARRGRMWRSRRARRIFCAS